MLTQTERADLFVVGDLQRHAFQRDGFVVLGPGALSSEKFMALRAEAEHQVRSDSWLLEGTRAAGEIAQESIRANLGVAAREFCSSVETLSMLRTVSGFDLEPGWSATCYTAYTGPSQHLGEHCDKEDACTVALLLYLSVGRPHGHEPSAGMQLHIFEGRDSSTPLVARITARENRAIVLHGSQRAHLRPRLVAGERIVALTACFARS